MSNFFGSLSLVPLFVAMLSCFTNQLFAYTFPHLLIAGKYRFCPHDDLAWRWQEQDDSACLPVKVPGKIPLKKLQLREGIGWYRVRFVLPKELQDLKEPAIYLGRITDADEVYLNGIKIGGEGRIGKNFIEAPRVFRLYRIPAGLLCFGKKNFLAIRVMNTWIERGLIEGEPVLGEYQELFSHKLQEENRLKCKEIGILTLFCLFFLFWLLLYLKGIRGPEYLAFGPVVFNMAAISFLDSLFFYETGLKIVLVQKIILFLLAILPANLLFFLTRVYEVPFSNRYRLVVAFFFLLVPGVLWPNYQVYLLSVLLWLFGVGVGLLVMIYASIRAIREQVPEARPLLVGVLSLAVAAVGGGVSFFFPLGGFSVRLEDLGFVAFLFSVMYALVERHVRLTKKIKFLSASLLEAQEGERKRLSRELHDGVAQQLLALKLNLEMMRARTPRGKPLIAGLLDELVRETQKVINELRGVVLRLRPSFLDERPLASILQEYGEDLAAKTGLRINVQASSEVEADLRVKDNLFRICQEALANVVKHAQASEVNIYLQKNDKFIYLEIKDDGCGFLRKELSRKQGIGLSSIRERVDSLGGVFYIESQPGKGTRLKIKVPEKV